MSRFNLVFEKWIPVITSESGDTELVSIKELFENANKFLAFACDTKTQEFAILRILLAINHTVFSRFDIDGKPFKYLQVDENFKQVADVDEESLEDYEYALLDNWLKIWESGKFPKILFDYLDKWQDRFYLFDDKYPFMQVVEDDVSPDLLNGKLPTSISGKNINRLISESNNKVALFSPKNDFGANKEILTEDEIARWLITFQGYSGLADKRAYGVDKYKASKGWIYDLGGIYLEGENLFESLMLNTVMVSEEEISYRQEPAWEYESKELLDNYLISNDPRNLSQLYTTWSRAVYIPSDINLDDPFSMFIVKLPDIYHVDRFLEPMTIWKKNESGEYKDKCTPKKHPVNQAMWRSFGLIAIDGNYEKGRRIPGVISWYKEISEGIDKAGIKINAISMKDDGNATSWVPADEIYDYLNISDILITDDKEGGWTVRIYRTVEETKQAISKIYKEYLKNIKEIRNIQGDGFDNVKVEELYYLIDQPFRDWISSIEKDDDKDKKILEWRKTLKKIITKEAEKILENGNARDFKGIVKNDKIMNIATAYSYFIGRLNRLLVVMEDAND
ncbi:MAG: type I-E CRISPR-associated protein Cse1/CasA [Tissierellia bacterium]|nr:type I-E CRISPR-associated protein Cse1/CasA [Tissierellia bacterium]